MIKIIEHGNCVPKEIGCKCGVCNCIFTATFNDFHYSQIHNKYLIKCPECSNIIHTSRAELYGEWS